MERDDRIETGLTRNSEDALPEPWTDTARDPRYPEGDVGVCLSEQGTMLYDQSDPGAYLIGTAVDLSEMA